MATTNDKSMPWAGNLSLAGIAATQIGVAEVPRGSNSGAAILRYQRATNLDGTGWPWCSAFIDWCMGKLLDQVALGIERPRTAAAFGLIEWAKKQPGVKVFAPGESKPFVDDIVVYTFSHCGIVSGPLAGKTFHAIEGNTNDDGSRDGYEVAIRERPLSQVKAFIRLPIRSQESSAPGGRGTAATPTKGKGAALLGGLAPPTPAVPAEAMKKGGAASGSVGLTAPLFLMSVSLLGIISPAMLGEASADPKPEVIKQWIEVFVYLAGLILLVGSLIKMFRPDPSADKKFATKEEMIRIETDSKNRDDSHRVSLTKLETTFETKHQENVRKLTEVSEKLDRNHTQDHGEREKMRVDVRHDMQAAVQPIQSKIEDHAEATSEQFQELAREIGGLKVAKETGEALAAEVRSTLNMILQRLPRGGASS